MVKYLSGGEWPGILLLPCCLLNLSQTGRNMNLAFGIPSCILCCKRSWLCLKEQKMLLWRSLAGLAVGLFGGLSSSRERVCAPQHSKQHASPPSREKYFGPLLSPPSDCCEQQDSTEKLISSARISAAFPQPTWPELCPQMVVDHCKVFAVIAHQYSSMCADLLSRHWWCWDFRNACGGKTCSIRNTGGWTSLTFKGRQNN